jgi:hypothetical protein
LEYKFRLLGAFAHAGRKCRSRSRSASDELLMPSK